MGGALHFDIDTAQLQAVVLELGATEKQVKFALSTACRRTATTLRTLAGKRLRDELQLRTLNLLRRRMKQLRVKADATTIQLWFGLNDVPVSWFKGRPKQTASGAEARGQAFPGAFVARSQFRGRRTVFKRTSKARLHIAEQLLPIEDAALVVIEDEIFVQAETIFWNHFVRDLRARTKHGVDQWTH